MCTPSRVLGQFQGCLAGGLVGDCLGSKYEWTEEPAPIVKIQEDIEAILSLDFSKKRRTEEPTSVPVVKYTDDTSMTLSVAKFLLEESGNYVDLLKRFVTAYETEGDRGYGRGMLNLFKELRKTDFAEPEKSAKNIFKGEGSFGNGSGMRAAPIALWTVADNSLEKLVDVTVKATKVTHTHPVGIAGGVFQVLAVRHGFLASNPPKTPLDILRDFEKDFTAISTMDFGDIPNLGQGAEPYTPKIEIIRKFIEGGPSSWTLDDIRSELKAGASGPNSIPTALFCFLAAFQEIPNIPTQNQFLRTIELAFALGGDTDTVGTMAGAICGAYVGLDGIPENLVKVCEANELILSLADQLYEKHDKGQQKDLTLKGGSTSLKRAVVEEHEEETLQKRIKPE